MFATAYLTAMISYTVIHRNVMYFILNTCLQQFILSHGLSCDCYCCCFWWRIEVHFGMGNLFMSVNKQKFSFSFHKNENTCAKICCLSYGHNSEESLETPICHLLVHLMRSIKKWSVIKPNKLLTAWAFLLSAIYFMTHLSHAGQITCLIGSEIWVVKHKCHFLPTTKKTLALHTFAITFKKKSGV